MMTKQQEAFMREAIQAAETGLSQGKGGPFGAVVVRDGKIIGRGCNNVLSTNDPTAHAEVMAIRDACKNIGSFQLDNCELYTTCEPCPMCLGAIYWARPLRVYYASTRHDAAKAGFDDSFIYDELNLDFDSRSIPMINMLADEAENLFEIWKTSPLKKPY
jgi:guanine deaminase